MSKIGVTIISYNYEKFFKELYESLPLNKINELVLVNGGEPYTEKYDCNIIQHHKNYGSAQCRTDGLRFLKERECDYYFLIEDDMLIKNADVFDKYIEASVTSKLQYFCFASNAWGTGPPGARTPRLKVQYSETLSINFYRHCCNEFTFRTKALIDAVGYYDNRYLSMFDVDNIKRITDWDKGHRFWYSPDIADSDEYVMNNPATVSRMNPNNDRHTKLMNDAELFKQKYGKYVQEIPDSTVEEVIQKLKQL